MKALVTGTYDPNYNRNLIIFKGLLELDVELDLFPLPKKGKTRQNGRIISNKAEYVDFVFLPSFTHGDVRFVKKHSRGKLLVFDPLISKYLTKAYDYKTIWPFGPRALKNYLKDYFAMKRADLILADTQCHKDYYSRTFFIDPSKICVVPVGVDTNLFFPSEVGTRKDSNHFKVGFYGGMAPLQGILNIAKAAHLLQDHPNISFEIIGDGFDFMKLKKYIHQHNLKNFFCFGNIPYDELPARIRNWDLALGIFGDTLKAKYVIPNKIYHYLASGVCCLTMDSKAIREYFSPGIDIVVCEPDPTIIANQILILKKSGNLRRQIAQKGFENVKKNLDSASIARIMIEAVRRLSA